MSLPEMNVIIEEDDGTKHQHSVHPMHTSANRDTFYIYDADEPKNQKAYTLNNIASISMQWTTADPDTHPSGRSYVPPERDDADENTENGRGNKP